MKLIKFEGTADEFAAVSRLFEDHANNETDVILEPLSESEEKERLARKAAYKAMLNRIPIAEGQMDLYRVLSGGELEYSEYLARMNRTANQIAGLHGALGKRIHATQEIMNSGLPGNMSAIVYWRKDGKKDFLGLEPEFIEVLRDEGIV